MLIWYYSSLCSLVLKEFIDPISTNTYSKIYTWFLMFYYFFHFFEIVIQNHHFPLPFSPSKPSHILKKPKGIILLTSYLKILQYVKCNLNEIFLLGCQCSSRSLRSSHTKHEKTLELLVRVVQETHKMLQTIATARS